MIDNIYQIFLPINMMTIHFNYDECSMYFPIHRININEFNYNKNKPNDYKYIIVMETIDMNTNYFENLALTSTIILDIFHRLIHTSKSNINNHLFKKILLKTDYIIDDILIIITMIISTCENSCYSTSYDSNYELWRKKTKLSHITKYQLFLSCIKTITSYVIIYLLLSTDSKVCFIINF